MRALLAFLMCCMAFPVMAQEMAPPQIPCAPTAEMRAKLKSQYQEVEISGGMAGPSFLAIFASPDGATWTAVSITGSMSCIVGAGEHWFLGEFPMAGDPA